MYTYIYIYMQGLVAGCPELGLACSSLRNGGSEEATMLSLPRPASVLLQAGSVIRDLLTPTQSGQDRYTCSLGRFPKADAGIA